MYKNWFTIERLERDTYVISEYKHWEETHCYLLLGQTSAILIDAGLGVADISQPVRAITSLPIQVVVTHVHSDHIGGCGYFQNIAVHRLEEPWLNGQFPLSRQMVLENNLLLKPCDFPPEFTMEELAEYAVKLTNPEKNQFGLALPTSVTYMQFLWANGGDADDPDTNTNLLNSEENVKTLEWLQDLTVNKKVSPNNITGPEADTMLQAGQIGMYMSGPWQINGLRAQGIDFGIAPCVAGSAGAFSPAGGCSYVIPKGTEESHKLAAYKFMQYWLTDDILKEWSQRNGFPVWSKTLMEDPEIQGDEVLSAISKATEIGRSYNLGYSLASQIDNDVMIPLFEKVMSGAAAPQDALKEASEAMDRVLAQ